MNNRSNNFIVHHNNGCGSNGSSDNFVDIKIEPVDLEQFLENRRFISHETFVKPVGKPPTKMRKIICNNINGSFPQIAIKREDCISSDAELLLVNGCWDTSNKIPNIIAEMHNINSADLQTLQNVATYHHSDVLSESRDFVNPSPRGSDSGIESDCTDGNLSWLLNYKIHELPPVPDTTSTEHFPTNRTQTGPTQLVHKIHFDPIIQEVPRTIEIKSSHSSALREDGKTGQTSYRYSGPKKPPFTYTELIEHALSEKGELTVSGIYQWISDHFPFYKQNDDRWKNSVRHNLSINPHFRKGGKAVHGAGHLWTIAQKDDKKAWQIKQRMQQFIQTTFKDNANKYSEQEAFDRELQAATASILGESFNNFDDNKNGGQSRRSENIEVEFINIIDVPNGLEDFLAPPVSKQEIVQECGLGGDFLITDLNPNTLGLNLTEAEVIAGENLYDEMSFEYYELQKN